MASSKVKGKATTTEDAAVVVAPAPAPAPPPSAKPPTSQPPPAYAQAKNAYEALWKQQSDTRPLATQAPASKSAAPASVFITRRSYCCRRQCSVSSGSGFDASGSSLEAPCLPEARGRRSLHPEQLAEDPEADRGRIVRDG